MARFPTVSLPRPPRTPSHDSLSAYPPGGRPPRPAPLAAPLRRSGHRRLPGPRPRLATAVRPRTRHPPLHPRLLAAAGPASTFLVVEQYADCRDAATWAEAIREGLRDLPLTVLLFTTDQARGLLACAEHDLEALHLPELFHGQRDLGRPLLGPLARQADAARKVLQQAEDNAQHCRHEAAQAAAGPLGPGRPKAHARPPPRPQG